MEHGRTDRAVPAQNGPRSNLPVQLFSVTPIPVRQTETTLLTQPSSMCIGSEPRSAVGAASGAHDVPPGCPVWLHPGLTGLPLTIVVDPATGSAVDPKARPEPAPDRVDVPVARRPWTPREIAVQLLGASHRGPARRGDLELHRADGEFLLVDLFTGEQTPCLTASDVVRAVEGGVR